MFFNRVNPYQLCLKQVILAICTHWLGAVGPTVQELWPFKVVQATKNAPLGRFFKKIILEVIFFWRQARNLTQTHPSNFPIGSRTLFFSYLDKKCPKWPKKQSKKRPKIGHHNTCELITPKLSQISASNWLSIYYYRTSLSTFNSNLLASCILSQSQPEFGPLKNCEKLHQRFNLYSFFGVNAMLFFGTWAKNIVFQ